jgi:hypothetical protein
MLAEVQAQAFVLFGDAQTHNRFQYEENDGRASSGEGDGCSDCGDLRLEKRKVPINQPVCTAGLTALEAKIPVAKAPKIPPAAWTPTTSSESS